MSAATDKRRRDLLGVRDTVEGIALALVLCIVLKAFLIEWFLVPTGSMAPQMLGNHCDLQCRVCGYEYAYGLRRDGLSNGEAPFVNAQCPLCGERSDASVRAVPKAGDRFLVLKYLYHFREPRPWDVVVFRNPQNNRENYTKRLVGLPGESIEIIHGDVFVRPSRDADWRIRRKPPRAQAAMWQVLFHNDYRPSEALIAARTAPVWQPAAAAPWDVGAHGRNFVFHGAPEPAELIFHAQRWHFFPRYGYNTPLPSDRGPGGLHTDVDVCTDLKLAMVYIPRADDSRVSLSLTSFTHRFKGEIRRDGTIGLWYYSHDHPDKGWQGWGRARLEPFPLGRGQRIALSHVDFRVRLWVNGKVVLESTDQQYDADHDKVRKRFLLGIGWLVSQAEARRDAVQRELDDLTDLADRTPGVADRIRSLQGRLGRLTAELEQQRDDRKRSTPFPAPHVRIAASKGACELRHVVLYRDVYYTTAQLDSIPRDADPLTEYAHDIIDNAGRKRPDGRRDAERWPGIQRLGRDPSPGWGVAPYPITLAQRGDHPDLDEFFVLGDNSQQSLDGRSWTRAAASLRLTDRNGVPQYQLGTVPRYNLIGKAFFVH